DREPGVYAALGIHPHQAGDGEAGRLAELRELLAADRAVAVGETGLDFYRDYAPRDRQLALFEAELALAADLGKPVVVHSRAADGRTSRPTSSTRSPPSPRRGRRTQTSSPRGSTRTRPRRSTCGERGVMSVAPKRSLGQHFLVDENILGVIGRLAELAPDDI